MKAKIIGASMLLIFLTSIFSGMFIIRPSLAQYSQDIMPDTNPVEGKSMATPTNRIVQDGQQGIRSEKVVQPSSNSDTWDFSNVSTWNNLAFMDGNKTRLIVGVDSSSPNTIVQLKTIAAKHEARVVSNVSIGGKVRALVVELPLSSVPAFVGEVQHMGLATYIEPNLKVQAQFAPNDPYWNLQWGPQKIGADWAWNTTQGSSSVLVAVVDTGIDYTHPDLAGNYVPLGYDWVNYDSDPLDDFGHGTHCSGIIAAVLNNTVGIAGTAQVHIMAEKVLDSGGYGYWDWVANGIVHAADQGANIISMSLGGYGDSELVHDAVKYAYDKGVLLVAAAGNDNTNMKSYPAAYEEVVAVAATDQSDNKAYFSNWGDWIELAAPGVSIYSTMPTYPVTMTYYYGYSMNYDYMSGTSMACPQVAGVAALVWSRYANKTREWVRQWLHMTVDDLGDPGFDTTYGFGRVDARKAVEELPPAHDLIAYGWETPPYIKPGQTGTLNARVLNFGESDEPSVTVEALANGTPVDSVTIGPLTSGTKANVSLEWNPAVEGVYNVTLYVVPVPGETGVENNVLTKYVYVGSPIKAVVLHSYGNILGETIVNWQALTNEWYDFGKTMVYIDYTSLNKEGITYEDIAATAADVLIISCAAIQSYGFQFTDTEIEAIEQYVHEGHGLIATAGTFYSGVPNNNKLGPLFGLNETTVWSGAAYPDLLHLLNTTHPIFSNVPNPLVFPNVESAVPADGRWDSDELVGGEYLAMGHYQESAIVTCRGLVYIAPWLEIIPPYYHHHLKLIYNAIVWSSYQKPAHELTVELEAPRYLQPGESALLNATVSNMGANDEINVALSLSIDDTVVNSTIIPRLAAGGTFSINYFWAPAEQRIFNLTAYSPPVLGEEDTFNNVDSVLLYVRPVRFVLFDSSHDTDGDSLTGNYLFLDQLLTANGFVVDELTAGPIDSTLLAKYDILVLVDPELDFSFSEMTAIHDWVLAGGGLLAIPDTGYPSTMNTLLAPYGVVMTGWAGGYGTTSDIANHTITQGVSQIYVNLVWEISATSPSTSLAWITDYGERMGFLSASEDGEVVVLSDSNVMDNDGLGMADNTRLMLNIFDWVGVRPRHDLTVSLTAPTFLEPNTSVILDVTVHNRGLNDETDVQLELLIDGTVADSVTIPQLLTRDSYTLSFSWTPTIERSYNVTAYVQPVPDEDNIVNNVMTKSVNVRTIKHVLFDQTHGTDYIGNYYKWVQSLTQRGYIIDTLYTYPVTPEALEKYDVFIIPQPFSFYTADELTAIQNFVFNGGGLLVIGDSSPNIFTELTSFAGITWSSGGVSGITEDITAHPVTTGVKSVYLALPVAIMYVNGTAQDLVRDTQGNIMLAVSEQISGKVMGFADEDSLWDYSIDQADNLLLANNMIDWLSIPIRVEHDLAANLAVPSSLALGESTSADVTVVNRGLSNETNIGLYLLVNGSVANSTTLSQLYVGESYTASFGWSPIGPAVYNVTAYIQPVTGEDNIANNVKTKWTYVFYTRTYIPHEAVGDGSAMNWHADDYSWPYTLPFDFPFYGVPYRTIYVSSNGLISFLGPDADAVRSVPALARKLAIAPAWFDWETYDPYDIYIWQSGNYVGIRWNVQAIGSGTVGNFEAILSSEGVIQFNYEHFDGPLAAIVGISNGVGHIIAEQTSNPSYASTVVFLPFAGKRDIAVVSVDPSTHDAPAGNPVDVSVVIENRGNFTENFEVTTYAILQNTSNVASSMQGSATRVYLDPSEYNFSVPSVSVGYRFNVTVRVASVADLSAWEVGIYFNETILKATGWFEPRWDSEYVFANEITLTVGDIGAGYAIAGAALLPGQQTFNGTGKLAIIEFEVTAAPQNGETYSSVLNINNQDTMLIDSNNADIPASKENGQYELTSSVVIGQYVIGTVFVTSLAPGERRTLIFTWNTTGVLLGDYEIHGGASPVPCETDIQDNICYDGLVTIKQGVALVHDVAVTNLTGLPSFAYKGWVLQMNVTVANIGNATEDFTVTLYYNTTAIASQPVVSLDPNMTLTLSFEWNTTLLPCNCNYTVSAIASTVPGETNTTNNQYVAGQVILKVFGDITGDGVVDFRDVFWTVFAFRSFPGRAKWNPNADLNRDGMIDMRDINLVVLNFRNHS